jgi:hypothetical protein
MSILHTPHENIPEHRIAGPGAARPGFRLIGSQAMTLAEFIELPDNPIQRDTVLRAGKARRLDTFDDAQRRVAVAKMPNGKLIKVDGHTRAYRWNAGNVANMPPPGSRFIVADVYACDGDDDLKALYYHFDSPDAADTTQDTLFGACRDLGLKFGSPGMKRMGFASAIKWLYGGLYGATTYKQFGSKGDARFTYEAVRTFRRSLRLMDTLMPDMRKFPVIWLAAALATIERDGMRAVYFWDAYNRGAGEQKGVEKDGIIAVRNLLEAKRHRNQTSGKYEWDNFGRIINGYESWVKKRTYNREFPEPKSEMMLAAFMESVKEAIELNQ